MNTKELPVKAKNIMKIKEKLTGKKVPVNWTKANKQPDALKARKWDLMAQFKKGKTVQHESGGSKNHNRQFYH